jgi:hypothetical protein
MLNLCIVKKKLILNGVIFKSIIIFALWKVDSLHCMRSVFHS